MYIHIYMHICPHHCFAIQWVKTHAHMHEVCVVFACGGSVCGARKCRERESLHARTPHSYTPGNMRATWLPLTPPPLPLPLPLPPSPLCMSRCPNPPVAELCNLASPATHTHGVEIDSMVEGWGSRVEGWGLRIEGWRWSVEGWGMRVVDCWLRLKGRVYGLRFTV